MRVNRKEQYSAYRSASRVQNELVYRDFLHQERHAFDGQQPKKQKKSPSKQHTQTEQVPTNTLGYPMKKEVNIKLETQHNRKSTIAKYRNSI
ncbi:MAG TPA: hypothetical protein K8V30_05950 [Metalysinibacillus jejuensis]|uniref:Uncharacterized protein n=1 Tax=Metalysinibacillus jejuensis TaxID=914327 RepID=A0A921NBT9_9BACL|nr:hypothetical protein [Metalysinibacillus jejuensis]HJH11227.1 hypothetical protein [Metalysinibacillus jejuensis]